MLKWHVLLDVHYVYKMRNIGCMYFDIFTGTQPTDKLLRNQKLKKQRSSML